MIGRWITHVACGAAAVVAAACGSSSSGSSAPTCADGTRTCKDLATVAEGDKKVNSEDKCITCHQMNMAGQLAPITVDRAGNPLPANVKLYPPNLTGDPNTGIGNWTDDEIVRAIRNGIDDQGLELCPQMQHFAQYNDYEAYSVVMYLRSIPTVNQVVPRSVCPPLKN
jgi:hypothetical protein